MLLIVHYRNCCCCPHIYDHKRNRILCKSCHCISHAVSSHLSRIIQKDIQPGLHSRTYDHRIFLKNLLYRKTRGECDLRNNGRNDCSFNICTIDMMNIKNRLDIDCILQFGLGTYRRNTLCQIYFFFVNAANNNVGISDINS